MPKEKLPVPENCPLEIWVSDPPVEEGCFARGSVVLPSIDKFIEITLSRDSKISIPPYIDILVPGQIGLQRFYYFAKGSFNAAFRNFPVNEGEDPNEVAKQLFFPPIVFKLPFTEKKGSPVAAVELDDPKRHVRIFNESNKAAIEDARKNSEKTPGKYFFGEAKTLGNGTIAPYIIGEESTAEEKCNRLIQLYNEEQRIVVDSYVKNNLLTDESGRTWIVDTGFALQLGSKDPIEQQDAMQKPDPKSKAASCAWDPEDGNYAKTYGKKFLKLLFPAEYNQKFPQEKQEERKNAIAPLELLLSMALLYIQEKHSEIKDVSCLKDRPELINYFAAAYVEQLRKKYFENQHEVIPAPEIKRDGEKLIGIDEADEKWQKLKVLKIEIDWIPKEARRDFPKTPNSAVSPQVSPDDGKAMPARAAPEESRKAELQKEQASTLVRHQENIPILIHEKIKVAGGQARDTTILQDALKRFSGQVQQGDGAQCFFEQVFRSGDQFDDIKQWKVQKSRISFYDFLNTKKVRDIVPDYKEDITIEKLSHENIETIKGRAEKRKIEENLRGLFLEWLNKNQVQLSAETTNAITVGKLNLNHFSLPVQFVSKFLEGVIDYHTDANRPSRCDFNLSKDIKADITFSTENGALVLTQNAPILFKVENDAEKQFGVLGNANTTTTSILDGDTFTVGELTIASPAINALLKSKDPQKNYAAQLALMKELQYSNDEIKAVFLGILNEHLGNAEGIASIYIGAEENVDFKQCIDVYKHLVKQGCPQEMLDEFIDAFSEIEHGDDLKFKRFLIAQNAPMALIEKIDTPAGGNLLFTQKQENNHTITTLADDVKNNLIVKKSKEILKKHGISHLPLYKEKGSKLETLFNSKQKEQDALDRWTGLKKAHDNKNALSAHLDWIIASFNAKKTEYDLRDPNKESNLKTKREEATAVLGFVNELKKAINGNEAITTVKTSLPELDRSGRIGMGRSDMRIMHNEVKKFIDAVQKDKIDETEKAWEKEKPAAEKVDRFHTKQRLPWYSKDEAYAKLKCILAELKFREADYESRKLKGKEYSGFFARNRKKLGTSATEKLAATLNLINAIEKNEVVLTHDALNEGGLGKLYKEFQKVEEWVPTYAADLNTKTQKKPEVQKDNVGSAAAAAAAAAATSFSSSVVADVKNKIEKPSADPAPGDNEFSDDEKNLAPAARYQSLVPGLIKGMASSAHHDANFEAAKVGIIKLLGNEKLTGGAYPGIVRIIAIDQKQNAADVMKALKDELHTQENSNVNLANRLRLCIISLEQRFPDLKSSEKSESNKP